VIGSGLIHAALDARLPAPYVARANDDSDLNTHIAHRCDAFCDAGGLVRRDAKTILARHEFSTQLDEYTLIDCGFLYDRRCGYQS
jgi:hypothetical protein